MSAWNYLFDSDLLQRMDPERLQQRAVIAASRMRRASHVQKDRTDELERQVGEMALMLRALLGMLKEKGWFDAAAFHAALDKIDAEDGVLDGRVTPESERPQPPAPPTPRASGPGSDPAPPAVSRGVSAARARSSSGRPGWR